MLTNKRSMTLETITVRLALIKKAAAKGDFEAAHSEEDLLYEDFIKYVAQANPRQHRWLRKLAALVLTSEQIEFRRHCA